MHRLACVVVRLMDSTEGGIVVTNGDESSLVPELKEKQNQDHVFLMENLRTGSHPHRDGYSVPSRP